MALRYGKQSRRLEMNINYKHPVLDVEYDYVTIIDILPRVQRDALLFSNRLRDIFKWNNIGTVRFDCENYNGFVGALRDLADDAKQGKLFLIHIVGHANESNMVIGDHEEKMPWNDLRPYLEIINSHQQDRLLLNMSTCFGLHAIKSVDINSKKKPFFAVIGAKHELEIADALDINSRFYDKLISGMDISQIVPKVNEEKGEELLFSISAEGYQQFSRMAVTRS